MLSSPSSAHSGHCDYAQGSKGNGFRRPFKLFSDHDIMNFLDLNEIPSEIDDVRFLRYINDHERLVKGLFLPFLFDHHTSHITHHIGEGPVSPIPVRPTRHLVFLWISPLVRYLCARSAFSALNLGRSSVFTSITLDADIDNFVNAIDELSGPRFWFQFLVAPSYPLFEALSSFQNESSIDEFLRYLFFFLSGAETCRFVACIIYIVSCKYLNKAASILSISWRILKFDVFEFVAVITLSFISYTLWAGILGSSTLQILFYIELFGLPIWYFRTFLRIGSFVLDAVFKCLLLWAKFNITAPFEKRVARNVEGATAAAVTLTPSHTSSLPVRPPVHPSSLNQSLPPPAPPAQQLHGSTTTHQNSTPLELAAEQSPDAVLSPGGGFGKFIFGERFRMLSNPQRCKMALRFLQMLVVTLFPCTRCSPVTSSSTHLLRYLERARLALC